MLVSLKSIFIILSSSLAQLSDRSEQIFFAFETKNKLKKKKAVLLLPFGFVKMGTGWRRAFCTTIPRDPEIATVSEKQQQHVASPSPSPSPRSCTKLGFFTNPSTPRLQSQPVSSPRMRCRTATAEAPSTDESPRLQCKTTPKATKTLKPLLGSNPSSPRTPLKLSLFKNSFKFRVRI